MSNLRKIVSPASLLAALAFGICGCGTVMDPVVAPDDYASYTAFYSAPVIDAGVYENVDLGGHYARPPESNRGDDRGGRIPPIPNNPRPGGGGGDRMGGGGGRMGGGGGGGGGGNRGGGGGNHK